MEKTTKYMLIFYLMFVLVKAILSYFVLSPSIFSDEYFYAKMARSFFYNFNFLIDNTNISPYPPLYPMLISMSYAFGNIEVVYFFIKVVNAVISSTVLIAAYFLAKEFLSNKKALITAILVAVLPMNFAFSSYIMSENLFYPLVLFTVYFLYKSYTKESYWYVALAGLFLGLTILTRAIAVIFIPIIIVISFILLFKRYPIQNELKKRIFLFVVTILVVLPWLIKKGFSSGLNLLDIFGLGGYSVEITRIPTQHYFLSTFLVWILLYFSYILLAVGVLFGILFIFSLNPKIKKDTNFSIFLVITLVITIFFILTAAHHAAASRLGLSAWFTGRPMGRYVDVVLSMILIAAISFMYKFKFRELKISKKLIFILAILFAVSSILTLYSLLPLNNMSLVYLGLIKVALTFLFNTSVTFIILLALLSLLPFVAIYLLRRFKINRLLLIFLVFFTLLSLFSYTITYYNANKFWYNTDQTELGLWFNSYDPGKSTVLFDVDSCTAKLEKLKQNETLCDNSNHVSLLGFWINDDIVVGKVDNLTGVDYVISKNKLNLNLIKQTSRGIYLYRVG